MRRRVGHALPLPGYDAVASGVDRGVDSGGFPGLAEPVGAAGDRLPRQDNTPGGPDGSVQISLRVIIGDSAANSRRFARLPIFRNEIASIL